MAVLLLLLATVTAVVIGRPESTDDLALHEWTATQCRTTIKVRYGIDQEEPPYPECSSRCLSGEELWIDGVVFKRLPELEEYELMVEMIYINGTLRDCRMVPYETGEQTTATQEARKRSMDSCSSIENESQDETLVLSHTERIPISPFTTPIHNPIPITTILIHQPIPVSIPIYNPIPISTNLIHKPIPISIPKPIPIPTIPIHKRLEGFSRVGNSYYMVSPEVMAYHEAGPYCESLGATLASVESSREQNLLQGILATGVWRARNDDIGIGIPGTRSNALCEHPVVDESNQYSCPLGYSKYKSSCYIRSDEELSYSEGENFCSARGAYPVFINSQEENDFLGGTFKALFSFIGLTDRDEEGKFVSKRFGFPFFTRWSTEEPNNVVWGEDCVVIDFLRLMSWNDVSCNSKAKMLCEKSAEIAD